MSRENVEIVRRVLDAANRHDSAKPISAIDLRTGEVKSPDIQNNGVTGLDVNEATLGEVPSAATANSANTANSALTANSASSAGAANTANSAATANNANVVNGMSIAKFHYR